MVEHTVSQGRAHPLGATVTATGVNFALFSQNATAVELLLFGDAAAALPYQTIRLAPDVNKTSMFWHVHVDGLTSGAHYGYRVDGPRDVSHGHRFNPNKVLIDPYAHGNTNRLWDRGAACTADDNVATAMRSVVIDRTDYDWEGDRPLDLPMEQLIIYELHVAGFTRSPTAAVTHPGTFAGLVEKIPYLQDLGVNAVELLPVFGFDEKQVLRNGPDGRPLTNYWGYSTISFFAPENSYCVMPDQGTHLSEFRDLVKALHRAGIAVILDVVFNHTDEGNHLGPTISFKGIDNSIYYHLVPFNEQYYMDYSGCGNTVNCNHPVVETFIVDCLKFWVEEIHVDGFRFDEGSILTRAEDGSPMRYPPVIWHIELAEELFDTKVIAEAWDAAGLYQIGYFPGHRWAEWNGRYRDDIRRFVKGDPGMIGAVAARLTGSADLYQRAGKQPVNSINFITAHDGFTLNDLVSYNEKRNFDNGENNADGINDNLSWNCGLEGPSDDPAIEELRERQIRNYFVILLASQGIPMFVAGDEVRRSQRGNNNAYCQNNDMSWFDWSLVDKNHTLLRFVRNAIRRRRLYHSLHRRQFFTGAVNERGLADITWHGCQLNAPNWDDGTARALAVTLGGFDGSPDVHLMMNMYWEPLSFELPKVPGRGWWRVVDTFLTSPDEIADLDHEVAVASESYLVGDRTVVLLISKPTA